MSRNLASVNDASAYLSHVIRDELEQKRKVALVTQMDPVGTAESDIRADWTTTQA